LTRVETARLGNRGAGFGNLAEEVKILTQNIESSGQGVLEASSVLHGTVQSAIARITVTRESAMRELPALLAEATAGMASLEENDQRAREVSLRQADEYKEVSIAFEDLVGALQFHDITRQKIEHVADALRRLGCAAGPDAGAALRLQSAQLSDAERVFDASIDRIEQDLDAIARRIAGMAAESANLLGPSSDDRTSFFLSMEGRFAAILRILDNCIRAEAETESSLAGLEQDLARMRTSIAEIGEIGIRLRRMAINATIRATQIGAAGRALDVLAGVMQRLADDSSSITGEASAALDAMTQATGSLSRGTGGPEPNPGGDDGILSEMRHTIRQLREASETSFARLSQIAALSSGLGDGIQSVRAGFSAGTVLAGAIHRACSALAQIGEQAGFPPSTQISLPQSALEDFGKHYTMQSEREVHQAITKAPEGPLVETAAVTAVAVGDNLGENVELF
jgi:methyl-accepting chemotaxis protein